MQIYLYKGLSMQPIVTAFFEEVTNTIAYIVQDANSKSCAIIDSVANFDYASGRISYQSADEMIKFIQENNLVLEWIIETHVHADHLTAAPYIKAKLGGKIAIGDKITIVQETFGAVFNETDDFKRDGSQFDYLFKDNETYFIGTIAARAISTPGHTPACMTHIIGDAAFVGDTVFMPDGGTARADFPGGNAQILYNSIQKILELPNETRLFMCHDYAPNGREILWQSNVGEQKAKNIHVGGDKTQEDFIQMRTNRDKILDMPRLIIPSLQVNMKAGELPKIENGKRFLKVPLNVL
jgi:glyoxylase-like metal-dependent hydrolase (beta-lactamase superfamily II)